MRKIVSFLLIAQLVMLSSYGLLIFRGYTLNSLIYGNTSAFTLNFDSTHEYEFFLNLVEQENLTVSRLVFIDNTHIIAYTQDLTMHGKIELRNGSWPTSGTSEFISNAKSGEDSQVGIINNITPGFNLSISHLDNTKNTTLDGIYYINTSNQVIVESILDELKNNILYADLFYISNDAYNILNDLTTAQIIEFVIVTVLIFICVFMSLIQYSIERLKSSSVLLLHGFDSNRIIRMTIIDLKKPLILSSGVAYLLSMIYGIYMGFGMFFIPISMYFILLCMCLILIYVIAVNLFIQIYLHKANAINILKGKKPYFMIQLCNHALKAVFTVLFLVVVHFSIENFRELNHRMKATSNWVVAQNYYTVHVFDVGQQDWNIEREITNKMIGFYSDISNYYNGFIMNSRNISLLDMGLNPYEFLNNPPPLEIAPFGNRIDISPNYLNVNQIIAVNDLPVQDQLIYDDYTLNILVPEKFRHYQSDILRLYLEDFYFRKVEVDNIYNKEFGFKLNTTPIEDLYIHIIYVKDDQHYFSFNPLLNLELGNMIKDPITVVYTGNVHPSFLYSNFTHSLYFSTDSINAYDEILPFIVEHGLESAIQRVSSTFDQNGRLVVELQEQNIRMTCFAVILLASSLTMSYSLVANYFDRNKSKLFLKKIFGYTSLSRNKFFVGSLFIYCAIILIGTVLFLGLEMFFIGAIMLLVDLVVVLTIEKRLLSKSYSEIMKGGY